MGDISSVLKASRAKPSTKGDVGNHAPYGAEPESKLMVPTQGGRIFVNGSVDNSLNLESVRVRSAEICNKFLESIGTSFEQMESVIASRSAFAANGKAEPYDHSKDYERPGKVPITKSLADYLGMKLCDEMHEHATEYNNHVMTREMAGLMANHDTAMAKCSSRVKPQNRMNWWTDESLSVSREECKYYTGNNGAKLNELNAWQLQRLLNRIVATAKASSQVSRIGKRKNQPKNIPNDHLQSGKTLSLLSLFNTIVNNRPNTANLEDAQTKLYKVLYGMTKEQHDKLVDKNFYGSNFFQEAVPSEKPKRFNPNALGFEQINEKTYGQVESSTKKGNKKASSIGDQAIASAKAAAANEANKYNYKSGSAQSRVYGAPGVFGYTSAESPDGVHVYGVTLDQQEGTNRFFAVANTIERLQTPVESGSFFPEVSGAFDPSTPPSIQHLQQILKLFATGDAAKAADFYKNFTVLSGLANDGVSGALPEVRVYKSAINELYGKYVDWMNPEKSTHWKQYKHSFNVCAEQINRRMNYQLLGAWLDSLELMYVDKKTGKCSLDNKTLSLIESAQEALIKHTTDSEKRLNNLKHYSSEDRQFLYKTINQMLNNAAYKLASQNIQKPQKGPSYTRTDYFAPGMVNEPGKQTRKAKLPAINFD